MKFDQDTKKFDQKIANNLIGHTLLLGLTKRSADDKAIERTQIFGIVEACDLASGMVLRLENGEQFVTAPMTWTIRIADPGIYHLKDTNKVVQNPDFVAAFSYYVTQ